MAMRIGYVGQNLTLDCTSSGTFRLASYSEERLAKTIENNLRCLMAILEFNFAHGILYFRITSGLIPFASHPINRYSWQERFKHQFGQIGRYIRDHQMRVGLHPGQYTLLNSPSEEITRKSINELLYHSQVLDLMGMDVNCKMQIHIGGGYGEKDRSILRFIERYKILPQQIKRRLVIENDQRIFSLADCLVINKITGIPIVLDVLHHEMLNNGESLPKALTLASQTWNQTDGPIILDYADQDSTKRPGAHAYDIDVTKFINFLKILRQQNLDVDIVLESKGKDITATKAIKMLKTP